MYLFSDLQDTSTDILLPDKNSLIDFQQLFIQLTWLLKYYRSTTFSCIQSQKNPLIRIS